MRNTSKLLPLALASAVLLPLSYAVAVEISQEDAVIEWTLDEALAASEAPTTAAPFNLPPVCNVTFTRGETVNGLTEVILDGSGSYDPEGEDLVYCWRVACPGPGVIDEHSATTSMFVKTAAICNRTCVAHLYLLDGVNKTICESVVDLECPSVCEAGQRPSALTIRCTARDCNATSHSQDLEKVTCEDFGALPDTVRIVATSRHGDTWFDGIVNRGENYTIDAQSIGADRLGTETRIDIYDLEDNLLQHSAFHTSCSTPLLLNDRFGANLLVGFDTITRGGGMGGMGGEGGMGMGMGMGM